MYEALDQLVLTAIGGGANSFNSIYSGPIANEAKRISATRKNDDSSRVLDRRLQALRRSNKIEFTRAHGWRIKT